MAEQSLQRELQGLRLPWASRPTRDRLYMATGGYLSTNIGATYEQTSNSIKWCRYQRK